MRSAQAAAAPHVQGGGESSSGDDEEWYALSGTSKLNLVTCLFASQLKPNQPVRCEDRPRVLCEIADVRRRDGPTDRRQPYARLVAWRC